MSDVRWFLRVFFGGGLYAFRANFSWIQPTLFVPMLLVFPIFSMLFFTFIGRSSGVADDTFFVTGNALLSIASGALFGMGFALDSERWSQTLPVLIASPANRIALFVGRGLPVIANSIVVSAFTLTAGWLLLDVRIDGGSLAGLLLAMAVGAFATTAFGLLLGALSLRYRNVVITANMTVAAMLIFCGVNIPRASLPEGMRLVGDALPLTRTVAAGRRRAGGASLGEVARLLAAEALIGAAYGLAGYALLRWFELQGRRHATLELS
jgi:ABC-2 type transport system permease protein